MAVSALVFAFKALLKIRQRLLDNYRSAEHLQQNLHDFLGTLRARPQEQVRSRVSPNLRTTLEEAQEKLNAFANAGWITRLGDWSTSFDRHRDNVLWALITHVAADVIDADELERAQNAAVQQPSSPGRGPSEIEEENGAGRIPGSVFPPGGEWGRIAIGDLPSPDRVEAQTFVEAAERIVEGALTREPQGWVSQITPEGLPVPKFEAGDAECFVQVLLVEGVDRDSCNQLAHAIEQIKCQTILKKMARLLRERLGIGPGKQAACQILKQLLNPDYSHNNVFTKQLIASMDDNVLRSLGGLLRVQGDVSRDSMAILESLTKVQAGNRTVLVCLGSDLPLTKQVFGSFCGIQTQDDPAWSQVRTIVRRLGSIRGSSWFCVKDSEVKSARALIEQTVGRMSGLPMTVLVLGIFKYG